MGIKGFRLCTLTACLMGTAIQMAAFAQVISPSPRDSAKQRFLLGPGAAPLAAPLAAPGGGAPAAAAPGTPRTIEVLLIADGFDTTLGAGFKSSLVEVKKLFEGAFSTNSGSTSTVRITTVGVNEPLTTLRLQTALAGLTPSATVNEDRAIFCYYWCHGTQIGQSASLGSNISTNPTYFFGHAMGLSQENNRLIPRYNVWQVLKQKNAGLTVLLSDSCFERARPAGAAAAVPQFAVINAAYGKQLRHLLEDFSGDVNITSSSIGELSWYLDIGLFTESFVGIAEANTTEDWATFYGAVRDETNTYYTQQRPGWIAGARDALTRQRLQQQPTQVPLNFPNSAVSARGAPVAPPGGGGGGGAPPVSPTLQEIKAKLDQLQIDLDAIRADTGALRTDAGTLRTDVDTLRTDVNALKK